MKALPAALAAIAIGLAAPSMRAQNGLDPVAVPGTASAIPRTTARLDVVPLDFEQKLHFYVKHTFTPAGLLIPALPAAIIMADPPSRYPRDWKDGAEAFGRNFGDCLATQLAANTGKFLAGAALREDPRYYPAQSRNVAARIGHAVLFTLVDRSDAGRPRLAISTLAGAASAGFVGRAYLPAGFDDNAYAGRRALGALGGYVPTLLVGYATDNLANEFSPELKWLGRKLHIPGVGN